MKKEQTSKKEDSILKKLGQLFFTAYSLVCIYQGTTELLGLTHRTIPNVQNVQEGYAVPSLLEIRVKDTDGDGNKETLLNYYGIPYRLKINKFGEPEIHSIYCK